MALFYYNGTDWVNADWIYVYDGSAWAHYRPYHWDENEWAPTESLADVNTGTTRLTYTVAAPTPLTQTYTATKTFSAVWSSTYYGNNDKRTDNTSLYQGYSSYASSNGNMKSLVGFTVSGIPAGATCTSAKLTLNAEHWYNNSGGTAIIGTHNKTTEPASFSSTGTNDNRLTQAWTSKTGSKTITLGNTIGNEFISGSTKGIMIGPISGLHNYG